VENYVKKNMMELNAIVDDHLNNLLNFAVQSGYYEIVELLIKSGLPINTKNVRYFNCDNAYRNTIIHLFIMP
jgi:ankyrin repeat protein